VLRLRQLLIEFHKHPVLKETLALKGGTALNLFYLNLARLSVEIDLNYIGQIEREVALRERPEIVTAVEQISVGLGYRVQNGKDDYALREWYLNFTNHAGRPDRIQVEINFLMRACALPLRLLDAAPLPDVPPCKYSILALEELCGGKIKAITIREICTTCSASRPPVSPTILNCCASSRCSSPVRWTAIFAPTTWTDLVLSIRKNWNGFSIRYSGPTIVPPLPTCSRQFSPFLQSVLDHPREGAYLEAMATGHYRPELLFPEHPEIVDRIRQHPALLWKADNVSQHLSKSKKSS